MPKRSTVLELIDEGLGYEEVGARLGINPGQAYMIATGLPADGSEVPAPEDLDRPGHLAGSTQHLSNPAPSLRMSEPQAEEWMARRAAADRQMLEAAARRPPGSSMSPAGDTHVREDGEDQREGQDGDGDGEPAGPDVADLLRHQHNEARALLKELEALPKLGEAKAADLRRKEWAVALLVPRLASHETAEQELFWPAVRDMVPGGVALAGDALDQERQAMAILSRLDGLAADDVDFDQLVTDLVDGVRRHVALEDAVLRRVDEALTEDQRRSLGRRLEQAERRGPTRPHRQAPTGPAALRLVRPVAAAADRARDRAGGRRRRNGREGDDGQEESR